jgi:hypothetical protein
MAWVVLKRGHDLHGKLKWKSARKRILFPGNWENVILGFFWNETKFNDSQETAFSVYYVHNPPFYVTPHKITFFSTLYADDMMASGFKSFSSIVSTTMMFICEKAIYKWEEEILWAPFYIIHGCFLCFAKLSFALCDVIPFCVWSFHDNVDLHAYDEN